MFKKTNRLAKSADVKRALARGRSFFNPFFTIKFLSSNATTPRFTVVTSTKVSKKAVRRNQLKRLARELLRLNIPRLKPGDYAVIVKPAAGKAEKVLLKDKLLELLKASKLIL